MENGFRSKQDSAANIRVEISFELIMPVLMAKEVFCNCKNSTRLTSSGSNIDEDLINGIHRGQIRKS